MDKTTPTLYQLVNVYDKSKKWIGQFINEGVAVSWLKKQELNVDDYEISRRRPESKRGKGNVTEEPTNS